MTIANNNDYDDIYIKNELLEQTLLNIEKYKKLKKILGKRKRVTDEVENEDNYDDNSDNNQNSKCIKVSTTQNDMVIIILFEFEAKVKLCRCDELAKILD